MLDTHQRSALLTQQSSEIFQWRSLLAQQMLLVAALALLDTPALVEVPEGLWVSKSLDVDVLDSDVGHRLGKGALRVAAPARDGKLAHVDHALDPRGLHVACEGEVVLMQLIADRANPQPPLRLRT